MSIQDDIFDVRHALDGMIEQETFDEIMEYFSNVEARSDEYRGVLKAMADGEYARKRAILIGESIIEISS